MRELVDKCLMVLNAAKRVCQIGFDDRCNQILKFYLKTGDGPTKAEVWALNAIFSNINNGLRRPDLDIKVCELNAYGSVPFERIQSIQAAQHRAMGRGVSRRLGGHGDLVSRGHINFGQHLLEPGRGLIIQLETLIHEASHRFANTRDYGNRGYTNEAGTRYLQPGLTRQEAILNADSVSWVAIHLAKPYIGWLNEVPTHHLPVSELLVDALSARRRAMGY